LPLSTQEVHPRSLERAYREELSKLVADNAVSRLWAKDVTLWPNPHGTKKRDASLLNWLDLPQRMSEYMPRVVAGAQVLEKSGFETLVFVGMGASNLAAEAISRMAVNTRGRRFLVFDSIDPRAIQKLSSTLDWPTTLFVFASKSGKLIEMHALLLYFLDKLKAAGIAQPGRHFVAVTDGNSYLAQLGKEYRFHDVFLDPPGIGGRFSSLIHFDLLLSAIGRVPPDVLSARSMAMQAACGSSVAPEKNPALTLAAFLSAGAAAGIDRLFLAATPSLISATRPLAQLIGSSIGKDRQGLVPISGEIPCEYDRPSQGCLVVALALRGEAEADVGTLLHRLEEIKAPTVCIKLSGPEDLGAELFKWELATVLACSRIGVNPFDQPDAQRSRDAARKRIIDLATAQEIRLPTVRVGNEGVELRAESVTRQDISTRNLSEALRTFLELRSSSGYLAVLAFLEETAETWDSLLRLRTQLEARMAIPVEVSYGPRYLHSLGQVYKGGPPKGLFVILTAEPNQDIPVPGAGYTFGRLQTALALGDFEALHQRNERVVWLHFSESATQGLDRLESTIGSALAGLRQIA